MNRIIFSLSFLLLTLLFATRVQPADAAADWDGIGVELAGFTPQQAQTLRDGFDLFADLASPQLARPALLRMSAVAGTTSTTYATWQGDRLVDVWITFGVDNLAVPQVVHELLHVTQAENPAWGMRERAYAAAHPYPLDGYLGSWIELPAPAPLSEFCPRTLELLLSGTPQRLYVQTQPDAVRFCLWQLSIP